MRPIPIPESAKPNIEDPKDKQIGWLVGALTTVALLLSAVGVSTGNVGNVLRNEPDPAIATFVLVTLASIMGASAGWLIDNPHVERFLLRGSVLLLALAVGAAVLTGIAFARERPEPSITASIVAVHGRTMLRFEIRDTGLKANDRMTIKVRALALSPKPIGVTALYTATLGPNASGAVDRSDTVAVPPAPYNDLEVQASLGETHTCYEEEVEARAGCTTVHVTRLFERPQLTISWRNPRHSGAGLFISLTARDVAEHRAVLRVADADTHKRLLAASWPSSATGNIHKAITVVIPHSTKMLCIAASTTESKPQCFAHAGSGTAWILTDAPLR